MGYWDPRFVRPLVVNRPVIMFDPPAVGHSTGDTRRVPSDSMGFPPSLPCIPTVTGARKNRKDQMN